MTKIFNCIKLNRKKSFTVAEEKLISEMRALAEHICKSAEDDYTVAKNLENTFYWASNRDKPFDFNLHPSANGICSDPKIAYDKSRAQITQQNITNYTEVNAILSDVMVHKLIQMANILIERHLVLPVEIGNIELKLYRRNKFETSTLFNLMYSVNNIVKIANAPAVKIDQLTDLANKLEMIITPLELFDTTTLKNDSDMQMINNLKKLSIENKMSVCPWVICPIAAYSVNNHVDNKNAPNVYSPNKFSQVIMSCSLVIPTLRLLKDNVDMLAKSNDTTREMLTSMKSNFDNMISQQRGQINHIYKSSTYEIASKYSKLTKTSDDIARSMFTIDSMLVILLPKTVKNIYDYTGDALLCAALGSDIHEEALKFLDIEVKNKRVNLVA